MLASAAIPAPASRYAFTNPGAGGEDDNYEDIDGAIEDELAHQGPNAAGRHAGAGARQGVGNGVTPPVAKA